MSGAEEYLDGLLHSVVGGSPADTARETEPGDTADGLYAEKEQETKKAGMSEEDDFLSPLRRIQIWKEMRTHLSDSSRMSWIRRLERKEHRRRRGRTISSSRIWMAF